MREDTIKRILKFTEDRDWDQFHSPANLAKSISIEANELLECFQWSDTDYDINHVKEELADVMVYCIDMLDKLKLDLMYITNYSLLLDLQIIFETMKILFIKDSTEGFEQKKIEGMHDFNK